MFSLTRGERNSGGRRVFTNSTLTVYSDINRVERYKRDKCHNVVRIYDDEFWHDIWYNRGERHRLYGPAVIYYDYVHFRIHFVGYWVHNKKHRLNNPSEISYYSDGTVIEERWFVNGHCAYNLFNDFV